MSVSPTEPSKFGAEHYFLLLCYWLGGWAMLATGVPSSVGNQLGGSWHIAWVGMLLFGPILTAAGAFWRDQWQGCLIRIAGGLLLLPALTIFLVGILRQFGVGTFTVWITLGLVGSTAVVLIRDCIRFGRMERVAKRGG